MQYSVSIEGRSDSAVWDEATVGYTFLTVGGKEFLKCQDSYTPTGGEEIVYDLYVNIEKIIYLQPKGQLE